MKKIVKLEMRKDGKIAFEAFNGEKPMYYTEAIKMMSATIFELISQIEEARKKEFEHAKQHSA